PFCPSTVIPDPIVRVVPPLTSRRALYVALSPKTTVPVPPSVWLPPNVIYPALLLVGLPTSAVPSNTSPFVTVRSAALTLLPTSNVPLIVTPLKVPLFTTSVAPPAVMIVPPSTVPPSNTHEPLAAFSTRVVLVLVSTPVRL